MDLVEQATIAYDWLQTTSKGRQRGKGKQGLTQFWLGWLTRKKAEQSSRNGTKPKPMTQHEKILADKARWDSA